MACSCRGANARGSPRRGRGHVLGDAGPPATIGAVDCPQSPPLLWSRTIADSFDFRIAADQNGNLYWIEYDSVPRWFLVSADSDGRDRYRVALPGTEAARAFVVSSGKVLLSQGTTIEGYDAATGAPAWTLDMKAALSRFLGRE